MGGTAVTTLTVSIADANTPIWFFDYATCAKGGVGVINVNRTSTETLEGFAVSVFCFFVFFFLEGVVPRVPYHPVLGSPRFPFVVQ